MSAKKWVVEDRRSEDLLDHLMQVRKIEHIDEKKFFSPQKSDLLDPLSMKDMDRAVQRIEEALLSEEEIWIYGDYDVDGISAVSILLRTFQKLGVLAKYYIPRRIEEGYGINKEALDFIRRSGGSLMISVDCGITSISEVDYAESIGLDVIITDHHQCKDVLPKAVAVIDPKQKDCRYENSNICGAGIAFKLAQELLKRRNLDDDIDELIEVAAVATIADIVELSGENRTVVKLGIQSLKQAKNPGLKALIKVSGIDFQNLNSANIAYTLAPKINSSGRLGKANIGVELLMASSEQEAESVAEMLDMLNKQRQALEASIYEEALSICEAKRDNKVLVACSANWHSGVIGIVASKITEYFHKPSMIIALEEDGKGKGSGRSVEGFNLFLALSELGEMLEKFGGHQQAAGITIDADVVDDFEQRINEIAEEFFGENEIRATLRIDAEVREQELSLDLYRKIEKLEPFGIGNTRPLFSLPNIWMDQVKFIGKNKNHVKANLGNQIDIIGFNKAEDFKKTDKFKRVDIVFELDRNEYMGKEKLQLLLRDLKSSVEVKEYIEKLVQGIRRFKKREREQISLNISVDCAKRVIFDELDQRTSHVFLVYSWRSLCRVVKNLYYRNIDFSIEEDLKPNISKVLIMPIIDKTDVSIYNSIILCDESYENYLSAKYPDLNFSVLYSEGERYEGLPSRQVIVKLFSLVSKKPQSVFNMDELCDFLETDIFGLILSLEILGDMSYTSYYFDHCKQNIKIVYNGAASERKYDLSETDTVKAFEGIFE